MDHGDQHAFVDGKTFSTALAIHDFDRELRLLLIDAIERVAISLRTRLANVLSLRNGPSALEDAQRNFLRETVIKHPDRAEATRVWNFPCL